jgi:hypothetical protein
MENLPRKIYEVRVTEKPSLLYDSRSMHASPIGQDET